MQSLIDLLCSVLIETNAVQVVTMMHLEALTSASEYLNLCFLICKAKTTFILPSEDKKQGL